jgi:hypothetical protein
VFAGGLARGRCTGSWRCPGCAWLWLVAQPEHDVGDSTRAEAHSVSGYSNVPKAVENFGIVGGMDLNIRRMGRNAKTSKKESSL